MIENVSNNLDSLVINRGEGSNPSTSPSSTDSNTQVSGAQGPERVRRPERTGDTGESAGRAESQESRESMDEKLQETVEALNDKLARLDREVFLKVDKRIDKSYISVIDKQSKETIREFPPEEIRTFIARFDQYLDRINRSVDLRSLIVNLEV